MFLVELQNTFVSTANDNISGLNQCGLCLTPFQSEFLSPNCQMYFFELKMFLVEMKNTFISALSVWSLPNTRALPIRNLVLKLPNIFVWIAKCIWLKWKTHLYQCYQCGLCLTPRPFQSQVLSLNCQMYLFELQIIFEMQKMPLLVWINIKDTTGEIGVVL